MSELLIHIAEQFSDAPGGRCREDGPYSGEEFRDEFLTPAMNNTSISKIIINFDESYGYATSFLEEAFGGLARIFGVNEVLNKLVFISNEEPNLIEEVNKYIKTSVE